MTTLPTFTVAYRNGADTIVEILATHTQATRRHAQLTAHGIHAVIEYHPIVLRDLDDVRRGRQPRNLDALLARRQRRQNQAVHS